MVQIDITNEPFQAFNYVLNGETIEFELRYLTSIQKWILNINFRDNDVLNGYSIGCEAPILEYFNLPFDVFIEDVNSLGLDPFALDNFSNGLYTFYIIETSDLEELRGYSVE